MTKKYTKKIGHMAIKRNTGRRGLKRNIRYSLKALQKVRATNYYLYDSF